MVDLLCGGGLIILGNTSFFNKHVVGISLLSLILIICVPLLVLGNYIMSNPPLSETLYYTGKLQNMEYTTNGFGGVMKSTLCFADGAKFTVDGYQEFGIGLTYAVTYEQLTFVSGLVQNNTLSVLLVPDYSGGL